MKYVVTADHPTFRYVNNYFYTIKEVIDFIKLIKKFGYENIDFNIVVNSDISANRVISINEDGDGDGKLYISVDDLRKEILNNV
jgi:predicted nucleotidyltransferase